MSTLLPVAKLKHDQVSFLDFRKEIDPKRAVGTISRDLDISFRTMRIGSDIEIACPTVEYRY
jgi:hypothetical protein